MNLWVALQEATKRPRLQGEVVLPSLVGQFAESEPAIPDCYASVPHVFRACCPPAIVWRVTAIVVDAVNLMIGGWARAHVRIKVVKRVQPTLADDDPPPPVAGELAMGGGVTAPLHGRPSMPLRRPEHAVLYAALPVAINNQAAARARLPRLQTYPVNKMFTAALAAAVPARLFPSIRPSPHDSQSAEDPADKVNHFRCHLNLLC